uniref:HAD family hydrolase n=1 Tax=Eiseniibacteriota bacterium TaxID=2212470 RepID=A0A832I788_UNCEI
MAEAPNRRPGAGERPPLAAVVFDAGGTLVRLDFEWMAGWLAARGVAVSPAALKRAEVEGRRRYDASAGRPVSPGDLHPPLGSRGDVRAYLGGTLDAAGVSAPLLETALEAFIARQRGPGLWTRPVEGAREVLDRLAALGLRLACVSNSDGRAERHLVDCGVREGLEFVVDSQHVGVEKPDPGIFAIALDRLGVAPAEALYVGDIRSVDEAGARGAGMRFVLLDPFGDYGAPGAPAIRDITQLPDWIARTFAVAAVGRASRRAGG